MNLEHWVGAVAFAAGSVCMSGCVVWEVRDELRNVNTQLAGVNTQLGEVNGRLDRVDAAIGLANAGVANANQRLVSVDAGLERVDQTNSQLGTLRDQLRLLGSIERSLGRLDEHLFAVRKTVSSIDSMIPGIDLGLTDDPTPEAMNALAERKAPGDGEMPGEPAAPAEQSGGASSPGVAPSGTDVASVPGASSLRRRDALLGAWIRRFPAEPMTLVILEDGRFVSSTQGAKAGVSGKWTRAEDRIGFDRPPGGTGADQGAVGASSTPAKFEWTIVSVTARALVVGEPGSGQLQVFGRP